MVLPSSWIVRIFCAGGEGEHEGFGTMGGSAAAGDQGIRGSGEGRRGGARGAAAAAYKVDADGRDVALGVRVVGEAQQQARLADARVADEHELEDVVVLLRLRRSGGRGVRGGGLGGRRRVRWVREGVRRVKSRAPHHDSGRSFCAARFLDFLERKRSRNFGAPSFSAQRGLSRREERGRREKGAKGKLE